MIVLDGTHLTIPDVIRIARDHEPAELSDASRAAVTKTRAFVDEKLKQQAVVYGLTTGFGRFSDRYIPEEETAELQLNLIRSHACAMGDPLPTEVVRAAMLLRVNALARGISFRIINIFFRTG